MPDSLPANGPGQLAPPLSTRLDALPPAHRALHNNFVSSVSALRRDMVRSCYYLLQVRDRGIPLALGFRTVADYAAAAAGLTPRQCRDFLELGRRLPRLPEIAQALDEGRLGWTQARIICAKAEPEEQQAWLEAARCMTTRELAEVSAPRAPAPVPVVEPAATVAAPAAPPVQPRPPGEGACHVTLRLTAEQYARWQVVSAAARGKGDLSEAVLAGLAGAPGRAEVRHLIVMLECPACGRGTWPTSRGELPVPRPLLEAAHCDAVIEDPDSSRRSAIAPRVRRQVLRRARYRCEAAGCGQAVFLQIHHRRPVAGAGSAEPENLVVLCWRCHRTLHDQEAAATAALRQAP